MICCNVEAVIAVSTVGDWAIYFPQLQGLGKRPVTDTRNQHGSENHLSWSNPVTKCSTYTAGYCTTQPDHRHRRSSEGWRHSTLQADEALLKKFHAVTKSNFRRFPRSHPIPSSPTKSQLTTTATKWFHEKSDGAHVTPLSVLAATQQPFLKDNPWAYSFKT